MAVAISVIVIAIVAWALIYMLAQKPATSAQQLMQSHRYEEAAAAAKNPMDRAEALKLLGRFDEAIASFRQSDDPAAGEGVALCLGHLGRDLEEAQRLMEEQIAFNPQIQEFQALALAYILLRRGKREDALRVFRDNLELLETRFRDDYTDRDPLLAETLFMYVALSEAAGDHDRAALLRAKAAEWAPGSVWK